MEHPERRAQRRDVAGGTKPTRTRGVIRHCAELDTSRLIREICSAQRRRSGCSMFNSCSCDQ
jgi:hypothetical protein